MISKSKNKIEGKLEKNQPKKNNRGITLVALIVTILVIIILATISISTIFRDGGIIEEAEKAGQAQANATASDYEAMSEIMKQYKEKLGQIAVVGQKTTQNFTINGEDAS